MSWLDLLFPYVPQEHYLKISMTAQRANTHVWDGIAFIKYHYFFSHLCSNYFIMSSLNLIFVVHLYCWRIKNLSQKWSLSNFIHSIFSHCFNTVCNNKSLFNILFIIKHYHVTIDNEKTVLRNIKIGYMACALLFISPLHYPILCMSCV